MIKIIQSNDVFRGQHGWLTTRHHFSFAEYHDPQRMQFGSLRVFNDDIIEPSTGFDFHPHHDMEIITYVIDGVLEHKDNLGNAGVIEAGEVQRMSAGTGVVHSEYNHSDKKTVRVLQMWVYPDTKGLRPSWEQKKFSKQQRQNQLLQIISSKQNKESGSMTIHQDASFYVSSLSESAELYYQIKDNRQVYFYVINGNVEVNGMNLEAQDAATVQNEKGISIKAKANSEIILVDLPVQHKQNALI